MTHVARSFLKWPGNKFNLIPQIQPHFSDVKLFVEPFAGSGVVHLNMNHNQPALVADINPDLINIFKEIQVRPDEFIETSKSMFTKSNNTQDQYLEFRSQYNTTLNTFDRAVLLFYLNRHSYNGLVRYNLSGHFNVPFGRFDNVYFPENEMLNFHKRSKNVEYVCADFATVIKSVEGEKNIGLYLDPPYMPLDNSTSNFTSYFGSFGFQEHIALANYARTIGKGESVSVISNHDSSVTRMMYEGAEIFEFSVPRRISCKGQSRNPVPELLAVFQQKELSNYHFVL